MKHYIWNFISQSFCEVPAEYYNIYGIDWEENVDFMGNICKICYDLQMGANGKIFDCEGNSISV